MSWSAMRDRMDRRLIAKLNDGVAQYCGPGRQPRSVTVMIERNLVQNGPEGLFRSDATGFTWRKAELEGAERGAILIFDRCRYVVEETVSDDGHFVTVACMESR
ncbi:head-tail joining protein [Pseudomonas songnenensis]|uniref:Uncharacterized protein n=1 Tax=Pseudomonas songnenensis TaxID=1176259 RepID=A0A482UI51_9PSED|nr:hypothetical protein [Pseudomonas songnenensis]RYJ63244.1 hypothetical protein EJA06_004635 [Pseudomonas songnenensis]